MTENPTVLEVKHLHVSFPKGDERVQVVKDVSFEVKRGRTLAIVGESGSGKTVSSLASIGLLPKNIARIDQGSIRYSGIDENLEKLSEEAWTSLRGRHISMIFQNPMSSLNPSIRVGKQVLEILEQHGLNGSGANQKKKVLALFAEVKLPQPENTYSKYPHELSGGQKQRIMIAMALACNPDVIIADEPTTALDVSVQKSILTLLKQLLSERNAGMIFISHDLDVVSDIADDVLVMYRGDVLEYGSAEAVLKHPSTAYTRGLIACKPPLENLPHRLPTVEDFQKAAQSGEAISSKPQVKTLHEEGLFEVRNLLKTYPIKKNLIGKVSRSFTAVNSINFDIRKGETLGLVGESGCGKSTVSRLLMNLISADAGEVIYQGKNILQASKQEWKAMRRKFQLIFQDPFSALNPRQTIGQCLDEVMAVHQLHGNKKERKAHGILLLEQVGLNAAAWDKYPHAFSGGQRQRIVIARALAVEPEFIICDESVSALDVSVQAQVLNLLNDLKEKHQLTYLFISHDLNVVHYMSDRIAVMQSGNIVELGEAEQVFRQPSHPYTKALIGNIARGSL
jgi:peptide/nickel transport system ATP-binding protein